MSRVPSLSSPFLIGFDQIERALDRVAKAADGYPPYNIERLAADDGVALGASVEVQSANGPVDLAVVGIVAGDGPFVGSAGRTVIVPIDAARRIFSETGASRVDIVVGEGATPTEVAAALDVALTSEPYVLSSPRDLATSLRVSTADFRSTTGLIAAVALFVGAFLIFNTLSMTVTERIREVGLLRAAGVLDFARDGRAQLVERRLDRHEVGRLGLGGAGGERQQDQANQVLHGVSLRTERLVQRRRQYDGDDPSDEQNESDHDCHGAAGHGGSQHRKHTEGDQGDS